MASHGGPAKVEKSAGGVVVRDIDGVMHALLIRDPYRNWGLPKGHLENGEGPREAAVREVAEETGLVDLSIEAELVTIDWFFRAEGKQIHKFTTFYLMFSQQGDPVPELGEGISECIWVPLEDAHERITYDNASEVVKVAQRVVAKRAIGSSGSGEA